MPLACNLSVQQEIYKITGLLFLKVMRLFQLMA